MSSIEKFRLESPVCACRLMSVSLEQAEHGIMENSSDIALTFD